MKKTTLCLLAFLYPIIFITAQVCQPSVPSSGQGSHELRISSSDVDFNILSGDCVDLTASFSEFGETYSYSVRSIPFNPSIEFGQSSNYAGLDNDDSWSSLIPIGFNFTFYQQCYSESRLSTNGVVSFDPSLSTNDFHFWAAGDGALIPNNTDAALRDGNIFGALHDLYPYDVNNPNSFFITYGVAGVAPFRVFTFNFFNVPQYSCSNLRTTQSIFLYESTNVVEVYLYYKPLCENWAGGRATLGIQNDSGTQGVAAPERNTAQWEVGDPSFANGEAWQFYPTGNATYSIKWYDESNEVVGTNNSINVCPTITTTYTAELTYSANSFCQFSDAIVTRCVTINVDTDTDGDGVADTDEDLNENDNLDDDDTDNDTIANYLDTDDDGDNVPTNIEISIDEGRTMHDLVDTDNDMIENYLDDDDDGDGLLTIDEDYNNNGDPTDDDTNTNGIPDYLESGVTLSVYDYRTNDYLIYPNPASDIINFQFNADTSKPLNIMIYNLQGKLLLENQFGLDSRNVSLDVSQLESGIYFIQLKGELFEAIEKLIIK